MIIMHILTYTYHCLCIAPWSGQAELQFESPPPASEGEEIEVEASGFSCHVPSCRSCETQEADETMPVDTVSWQEEDFAVLICVVF